MATIIPNLIILGPQGSGKSTQANLLVKRYGYLHISTGQLIRARSKKNDKIANIINQKISKGQLINNDILFNNIIIPFLKKNYQKKIIFDGIPRSLSQLKIFNTILKKFDIDMPYLLYINISKSEIVRRVSNRLICSLCGRIYKPGQKGYSTGLCSFDHKKLIKRKDDLDKKTLEKRLEVFKRLTKKIIPYYKKNQHIILINGEKNIIEVDKEIRNKIKTL